MPSLLSCLSFLSCRLLSVYASSCLVLSTRLINMHGILLKSLSSALIFVVLSQEKKRAELDSKPKKDKFGRVIKKVVSQSPLSVFCYSRPLTVSSLALLTETS